MEQFAIRKTQTGDMETVRRIYAHARSFMKEHGNPTQWGDHDPSDEVILCDIKAGKSYICESEGRAQAVFYFAVEEEPSYQVIIEGSWFNNRKYGVIHRIASLGEIRGSASYCIRYCLSQWPDIRIDTHRDNIPMQHLLSRHGFQRCGVIYVENGSERIAYQSGGRDV